MLKMIFTGKKGPDKTQEEFQRYYSEVHGPLFLKTVPTVRKYVMNFPVVRPGKEHPFDFVTEIWWDDMEAVRAFYKSDEYRDIIQPDEVRLGAIGTGSYYEEIVGK